jgi:ubiquinone biosynthesis monooxygenase Coq7
LLSEYNVTAALGQRYRCGISPLDAPFMLDPLLIAADNALRTLAGSNSAARPNPGFGGETELTPQERRLSGALMRVNHVGEVCAQALYHGQALATGDADLKRHFDHAARDETDHLAWTRQRLDELGSRASLLNPLWYAGAFAIGVLAGRRGNAVSLGFVVETERQVERHLDHHLTLLPAADAPSRAIVEQMKQDEAEHARAAEHAGAAVLPAPLRWAMRAAAKVMTTTARHL